MNRGSAANPGATRIQRTSFNEAPIHESGKCVDDGSLKRAQERLQ